MKSLLLLAVAVLFLGFTSIVHAQDQGKINLFYGQGCPHCGLVLDYFEEEGLFDKYPVERKEIYFDNANALLYTILLDDLGYPQMGRGVPLVVMGNTVISGDKPIIESFVTEADKFVADSLPRPEPNQSQEESVGAEDIQVEESGEESNTDRHLDLTVAAVVGGSLVDAINPCAFAVLIILMSAILAAGNSRKALFAGLAFSVSIFISYFLMGLGLYKALSVGGLAGGFFKIVGWVAIVMGLANLKDYFWYGKGFLVEVPLSWRPRLKSLINSVTSPLGAFGVGFLVSLFLLPCTSGPYIVILGMLAQKAIDIQAIFYLILYNLIFVTPMVIITLAVYKGFNPQKAEEARQKRLRILHLIAGLVMLAMGVVILLGWI